MKFKKEIETNPRTPIYATEGSAGCDLTVAEFTIIPSKKSAKVNLGLAFEIPKGYFGLVVPRSSLFQKTGLIMTNSVGIIDSDYRGFISANLYNTKDEEVILENGERIMQIIFIPYIRPELEQVKELSSTIRGTGGYGSTDNVTHISPKKITSKKELPKNLRDLLHGISGNLFAFYGTMRIKSSYTEEFLDTAFEVFSDHLDEVVTTYVKSLGYIYESKE